MTPVLSVRRKTSRRTNEQPKARAGSASVSPRLYFEDGTRMLLGYPRSTAGPSLD